MALSIVITSGDDGAPPREGGVAGGESAPVAIERLVALARELGADAIEREAGQLATRVSEGRFFVACVGQFKRGKSTLINALLGAQVLPTGVLPVTAIPTIIRFASRPAARVETTAEGWRDVPLPELVEYVSEEQNPENRRGVRVVEVSYPAAVLANGLCLVDTPGIGSVFLGNTATTRDFIPQIDAALVVIGVDPPLAADELALIEDVARQVRDIVVVMNKADRFTTEERAEASAFAEGLLEKKLGRPVGPVLQVSAADQFTTARGSRDWQGLLLRLERLGADAGVDLVRGAAERGTARLLRAAIAEADAQRSTLLRPVADSERRLLALRATLDDAAQRALELSHLFTAEEQRLSGAFAARRESFLRTAVPEVEAEFEQALSTLSQRRGPRFRELAREEARRIGRARIEPWLEIERAESERQYAAIARRFIDLANEFLARIAEADAEEFSRLPRRFEFNASLRVESRYYFHRLDPLLYGSGWESTLDWIRPRASRVRSVMGQLAPYLRELIAINSTRVEVDVHERVVESRRRLEGEIQHALSDVYAAAKRGVTKARQVQAEGQQAVQAELRRLEHVRAQLEALP